MSHILDNTIAYIKKCEQVLIAFSGGVDSTLLAILANQALGHKAHIVTIATPYMGTSEIHKAQLLAQKHKLNHQIVRLDTPQGMANNPSDRCYICKSALFQHLGEIAKKQNINHILEGSNADDVSDYRPGMRALYELNIKSPFLELGITKRQIRDLSQQLHLETWNTPSTPCLLTRLPYDKPISIEAIKQVEQAERFLSDLGFAASRVRHEDKTARVEVSAADQIKLFDAHTSQRIRTYFTEIGFTFVSVDLKPFVSGSMNVTIDK